MEIKEVLPSLEQSYEWLCHETGRPRFMLPLRGRSAVEVGKRLAKPRLERAIGVIYRPQTELASHYELEGRLVRPTWQRRAESSMSSTSCAGCERNISGLMWTDAFGVVLLVSLYRALAKDEFLGEAEWLVAEIDRVLGRPRGIRIGEEPDRDDTSIILPCGSTHSLFSSGAKLACCAENGCEQGEVLWH